MASRRSLLAGIASCLGLAAVILCVFLLTGCQTQEEWEATQIKWAEEEGLICDKHPDAIEHVAKIGHSAAQKACHAETPQVERFGNTTWTTTVSGCFTKKWEWRDGDIVLRSHVYYTEGEIMMMCHERTHAWCGEFHDSNGKFDKRLLKACRDRLKG